jgi:hypothetical protein
MLEPIPPDKLTLMDREKGKGRRRWTPYIIILLPVTGSIQKNLTIP